MILNLFVNGVSYIWHGHIWVMLDYSLSEHKIKKIVTHTQRQVDYEDFARRTGKVG